MSDWIEWNGGECPVPGDTLVDIELRSGSLYQVLAHAPRWNHDAFIANGDIIAYRKVKPSYEGVTGSDPRNHRMMVAPSPDLIQWAVRQHSCAVSCILVNGMKAEIL